MIALNSEQCKGCGICVTVCPQQVMELAGQSAIIAHEERCMECAACSNNCHYEAITVTKGTGCLVAIVKEDIFKIRETGDGCCCS